MKTLLFIISVCSLTSSLSGQCPNRDFLWNRILYLRDKSSVPGEEQLKELLHYEKQMEQCSYRHDSTHALLLQRIGWLYSGTNDYVNGIQYTSKAISLIDEHKNKPNINSSFAIKCYWNLSLMYDNLNLDTKKELAIDSCISRGFKKHTQYDTLTIAAFNWRVKRFFEAGDYYRCKFFAEIAETFLKDCNFKGEDLEVHDMELFTWRVNALNFLKQTTTAEEAVNNKIRFYAKSKNPYIPGTLNFLHAEIFKNTKPLVAIGYYKTSFDCNLRIPHYEGCAQALNNIGYTYATMLNQYQKALPFYFKALKYATAGEALNISGNIAKVYATMGNYDSAFSYFQKAFNYVEQGFDEAALLTNDKAESAGNTVEYVTGLVLDKADALLQRYKTSGQKEYLQDAIRIYQLADRYFDKLKISQSELQSKLFWKTNNRRLYEHAVEACYANQNTAMAFYFFEKSRSVLLNDQIMEQRKMDDASIAKQAQLKRNILDLERLLGQTADTSKEYKIIQQKLYAYRLEQKIFDKEFYDRNPSFAKNYLDTSTLTIEQVRNGVLKGKNSLLEIFTGDSTVYILSITPDKEYFTKVDKGLYDSLTNNYISFIINPDQLRKNFRGFVNNSNGLYKLIFRGIQLPAGGSLIVSPDGKSFPFECLVSRLKGESPNYLLNDYAMSYTYSAKYLANQVEANTNYGKSILGMAPVKYNNRFDLASLPGSEISLENIKREFVNGDNFILTNATRRNFLQHFSDYSIIQLYTHASENSANNDPIIYFSDSILHLSELIADRKSITRLIVLSACETANGKLYEGEGIFNFNRGFAALGIPAAVSNLWAVENLSTYRITELFYKYLSQGLETDVALQKAKIDFIKTSSSREKQLPYFWAGTILVGKADTIRMRHQFPWQAEMLLGVIILLAGIGIRRIIVKHNTKKRQIFFDTKEIKEGVLEEL